MSDEMKLLMALCDVLGFNVDTCVTKVKLPIEYTKMTGDKGVFFSETDGYYVESTTYKLTKKQYVQVGDGDKYDIKDVFRSGGVLYWKDKK